MTQDLITPTQAAQLRGVTRAAISDLIKRGRLRTQEIAGKVFVYRSEVESFEPVRAGWPKGKPRKTESAFKETKRRKISSGPVPNSQKSTKKDAKR